LQELERIFQELAVLPGYIGAEYGRNETLAEEVVGLAAWKSEDAFRASLPPGALYEIKLFRRVI
jgi:heme-degrading monooxygenase HmoA